MCRVVAYLGEPLLLDVILRQSDSSLVHQTYDPKLAGMLNLAGCGVAAWSTKFVDPDAPLIYRAATLPMHDDNLRSLSAQVAGECLLAHVRGTNYWSQQVVRAGRTEVHPFHYDGFNLTLAHNGTLARFGEMRFDLLEHIDPAIARRIEGTTDSEWLYALLLSQVDDPSARLSADDIAKLVTRTLEIVGDVRRRRGIEIASGANLFVTDGRNLVATRFVFDFGCYESTIKPYEFLYHSLWYTAGRDYGVHGGEWRMGTGADPNAVLLASEPLTVDVSTWVEVPEYTVLAAARTPDGVEVATHDLDV